MMKKGKTPKSNSKSNLTQETIEKDSKEKEKDDEGVSDQHADADMEGLQASMGAIHKEILSIRSDLREELSRLRDNLSSDMKKDLSNFREEINGKLNEIVADMKETRDRAEESLQRVAEMEEWAAVAKQVLSQTSNNQDKIQAKLTELEAHSRRNNIRVYGIPEDTEGNNLLELIESFIKTELSLQDIDLAIQRCHRAAGPKPPPNATPRSVVIHFLAYRNKDLVLRSAWKKGEMRLNQQRVYFDQDYPAETQKQRKAYAPIRKLLKEKGLRFQTPPPAKLRVFFEGGPVTYNNAAEAIKDMQKKGFIPDSSSGGDPPATTPMERLDRLSWETAGAGRRNPDVHGQRAKEKLSGFRYDTRGTAPPPK